MILTPETLPTPKRKIPHQAKVTVSFVGLRFTKAAIEMMGLERNKALNIAVHLEGDKFAIEVVKQAYPIKSYNGHTTWTVTNRTLGEFLCKYFKSKSPSFLLKKITNTLFKLEKI